MKIIKIISSLLVISAMTIISSGCTQNQIDQKVIIKFENLTVLETSFYSDAGKHAYEYDPWSYEKKKFYEEKAKSSAPKEFTVEFNGEKYTGAFDYVDRIVPGPLTCYYHGEYFDFEINAKTKELVQFSYHAKAFDSAPILDEAKCRADADAFASKYIEVDQCRVDIKMLSNSERCMFTYTREINGMETGEYIYLIINGNGNITDLYLRMHNAFDNVVAIVFDEEKVFDAIEAKLATIYEGVDDYEGYTVDSYCVVKLDNGEFGIMYDITAELGKVYSADGSSFHYNQTYITLLITGATVRPAK